MWGQGERKQNLPTLFEIEKLEFGEASSEKNAWKEEVIQRYHSRNIYGGVPLSLWLKNILHMCKVEPNEDQNNFHR